LNASKLEKRPKAAAFKIPIELQANRISREQLLNV
jgi:hypothetical protein